MWQRRRCGRRGRQPKPVTLGYFPTATRFTPQPLKNPSQILLNAAELEAIRLVDLEKLTQEEAGRRMGVSRGTIYRLLETGRRKIAQALTEGREIKVLR